MNVKIKPKPSKFTLGCKLIYHNKIVTVKNYTIAQKCTGRDIFNNKHYKTIIKVILEEVYISKFFPVNIDRTELFEPLLYCINKI